MRIKKTLLCLAVFFIFSVLYRGFPSSAAEGERRVFDEAGLFTAEENERLETQIQEIRSELKMDVAVLTIDDAMGKSSEVYADDFYNEQGMGTGNAHSGALFLIDMDNREIYISSLGEMTRYLTDDRVESILDISMGYASDGDYAACASAALSGISQYVEAGIVEGQYNYDRDTGEVDVYQRRSISWYEAVFALVASGGVAALTCLSTVKQYKMKKVQKQALNFHLAYRGASPFAFSSSNDLLINKRVTQRRIPVKTVSSGPKPGGGGPRPGSSAGRTTVHRSSSGRSHGGGGRKF